MTLLQMARGLSLTLALALVAPLGASLALAQKAPAVDPVKLAAAKELMAAQGGIDQARKGLQQMTTAMIAEVRRTSPTEADGFAKFMATYVGPDNPKVTKFFEDVLEASTIFYAERCTIEEMKAMAAFMQTPAGKKFVAVAPEAAAVIAPRMIQFQQSLIADVQAAAQRGDFKK